MNRVFYINRFPNEINALIIEHVDNVRDIEVLGSFPELYTIVKELYSLCYITLLSYQAEKNFHKITNGLDGVKKGIYNAYQVSFNESDTNFTQSVKNTILNRIVNPNLNKFKNYKFVIYECHTDLDVGAELSLIFNIVSNSERLKHKPYSIKLFKPFLHDLQKSKTDKGDALTVKLLDEYSYGLQLRHDEFRNRLHCSAFLEKYSNIRSLNCDDLQVKDFVNVNLKTIEVITKLSDGTSPWIEPAVSTTAEDKPKTFDNLETFNAALNKSFTAHKMLLTDKESFDEYVLKLRKSKGICDSIEPTMLQLEKYRKQYIQDLTLKEWRNGFLSTLKEIQRNHNHQYKTICFQILHDSTDWEKLQQQKSKISQLKLDKLLDRKGFKLENRLGVLSNPIAIAPILIYPLIRMSVNAYNSDGFWEKLFWISLIVISHAFYFVDSYYLLLFKLSRNNAETTTCVYRFLRRSLRVETAKQPIK